MSIKENTRKKRSKGVRKTKTEKRNKNTKKVNRVNKKNHKKTNFRKKKLRGGGFIDWVNTTSSKWFSSGSSSSSSSDTTESDDKTKKTNCNFYFYPGDDQIQNKQCLGNDKITNYCSKRKNKSCLEYNLNNSLNKSTSNPLTNNVNTLENKIKEEYSAVL
jgi:hypothetical protein